MTKTEGPPYVYREVITPEQAAEFLARNIACNRKIREHRVAEWVDAIEKDQWLVTHQPIAITKDNELLDGQHRLTACVRANKSIETLIAYDCDPATFRVIDNGLVRDPKTVLNESGRVVAMARLLFRITNIRRNTAVSAIMIEDVLKWCGPLLRDVDEKIGRRGGRTPITVAAVVHVMAGRMHSFDAFLAFHAIDKEAMPPSAYGLLQRLLNGKTTPDAGMEMMVRAYRAFDPRYFKSARIVIADVPEVIDEMARVVERYRDAVLKMPAAAPAANDSAPFPLAAASE